MTWDEADFLDQPPPHELADLGWPLDRDWVDAAREGHEAIDDRDAADRLLTTVSSLMVSVATGGPRIEKVNQEYVAKARALGAILRRLGIKNPNPFGDLWQWHGHWSQHLPKWAGRRGYVADLYEPVRHALDALAATRLVEPVSGSPTGWPQVDAELAKLRERFRGARDARDFNAVGLQCAATLQALGRAVFDPVRDLRDGEGEPSPDDAKRRIDYFLRTATAGRKGRYDRMRELPKPLWDLSQSVKHAREPDGVDAEVAANATLLLVSLVRTIAVGEGGSRSQALGGSS